MSHYTDFVKSASSLSDAKNILNDIYNENPKHWPNGLTAEHFDGGLYLIRKSASHEPVGFVGWQERYEGLNKVGYYSIGIKPEFRRLGFAKEAVTKLLAEKASSVDVVKALVEQSNKPSIELASQLSNVKTEVTKSASTIFKKFLPNLLKSRAGSQITGAAAGGAGAHAENEYILGDDASPALKKVNLILGTLTGGALGGKLRSQIGLSDANKKNVTQLLNESGLTYKQLGLLGTLGLTDVSKRFGDYTASAQDRVDTELAAAKANLQAENIRIKGNMWKDIKDYVKSNPMKSGIIGGGIGASVLGAYLYNALKKPNKPKPGVMTVEIPQGEVRDRFYTNLSRNMLFKDDKKKNKNQLTLANT